LRYCAASIAGGAPMTLLQSFLSIKLCQAVNSIEMPKISCLQRDQAVQQAKLQKAS
jgi:hypothetical protein